jgi:hypothetical protein
MYVLHRKEIVVAKTVSLLLKQAYGIDYIVRPAIQKHVWKGLQK